MDFENLSLDYPTFDILIAIFYLLRNVKKIVTNYTSNLPMVVNLPNEDIIDMIVADTSRIAIYGTISTKKRNKEKK